MWHAEETSKTKFCHTWTAASFPQTSQNVCRSLVINDWWCLSVSRAALWTSCVCQETLKMAAERGGHVWHRWHHRPPRTSQTDGDLMSLCTDVTWQQTLHSESQSKRQTSLNSRRTHSQEEEDKIQPADLGAKDPVLLNSILTSLSSGKHFFFKFSDVYWAKELSWMQ